MRIISGKFKGRRFNPPKNNPARPTTDFAKEGLFNIIQNNLEIPDIAFLDLFGGTGSLSFEMASRGCMDITNIELHPPNVRFIMKTSEELGVFIDVIKENVFRYLDYCDRQFEIIFAGPPYKLKTLDTLPDLIFSYQLLKSGGWFILEHDPSHNFDDHTHFRHRRNYGSTNFSIFIQ